MSGIYFCNECGRKLIDYYVEIEVKTKVGKWFKIEKVYVCKECWLKVMKDKVDEIDDIKLNKLIDNWEKELGGLDDD